MTEETKKLFNAPWKLKHDYSCVYRVGKKHEHDDWSEVFDVLDNKSYEHFARFYDNKIAKRYMRLPELYEALIDAAYKTCHDYIYVTLKQDNVPLPNELIEKGCPMKFECSIKKAWEVLKKVKEGK